MIPHVDHRKNRVCRGFTLLELIIATVLMSILMVVTWNLLDIYRNQFERNQVRVERWQLLRSLTDQLSRDLRSCNVRSESESVEETEEGSVGSFVNAGFGNGDEVSLSQNLDWQSEEISSISELGEVPTDWSRAVVGLEGTTTSLTLDLIVPAASNPRFRGVDLNRPPVSDFIRRVVYQFQSPRVAIRTGYPPGLVRCEWKAEELLALSILSLSESNLYDVLRALRVPGIPFDENAFEQMPEDPEMPTEGPYQSLDQAISTDFQQRVDYVPELKQFRLRYFDGRRWSNSWSAEQEKSLPVAVELKMDLTDPFWLLPDPVEIKDPTERAALLLAEEESLDDGIDDERLRSSQLEPPKGFRRLIYLRPPTRLYEFEDTELSGEISPTAPDFSAGSAGRNTNGVVP